MQAFWGTTALPANGAEITSSLSVAKATEWGRPLSYLVAYTVTVYLDGTSQANLTAKENAFILSLKKPGKDFVFKTDAGAASSLAIFNAKTASGTRVIQIATPRANGNEFVNQRTITFVVTAEYHAPDAANAVISWTETVSVQGTGGPRRVWRFPINATAIRQIVTPFSLVTAVQAGQAVGYLRRPTVPPPLFPLYEVFEARGLSLTTPHFMGAGEPVDWPVSWSYQFQRGDGPLVAAPRLPPGVI